MNRRRRRRRRRGGIPRGYIYLATMALFVVVVIFSVIGIVKYTPTKEHLDLKDYYKYHNESEAALLFEGEYMQDEEDSSYVYAICDNNHVYLELDFVKDYIDDGYVYDDSEITLRYATANQIYTALVGSPDYFVDKSSESLDHSIVMALDNRVYISAEYLKLLSDFEYSCIENPARVIVERAGYEKEQVLAKRKTQIRKLNGPKSPVVEDVVKGEKLNRVRDTGKWSYVVSENGVAGYIRNNTLSSSEKVKINNTLEKREYNHISFGKPINMAWQQLNNSDANANIANIIADVGNINVISPTWFMMVGSSGEIRSLASETYVNYCHANDIQVWALVSNLEDDSVDLPATLNTTSSRDNLVNNLIAKAITSGIDGINVDIEELPVEAADGYIEFIRELSIKCEKNDIILSVDNYMPAEYNSCYNRAEQAKYADYVVMMGYDEHYAGSQEAGSVASIGWVKEGIQNTLSEVPAEQLVLGMPFYSRIWSVEQDGSVSSSVLSIAKNSEYISSHGISVAWDDNCKQNYAEYIEDGVTKKIWFEDTASLEEKLKLIGESNLAGGAFWKIGLENQDVWNLVVKYL